MNLSRSSPGPRSAIIAACLCLAALQSALAQTTPKLYSVARADGKLRELNPATAATVSSVEMVLTGRTISGGTGLAADPTSGKFYALLRLVPFVRDNPTVRQLVTVDVTTGVVTDIGFAGGQGTNLSFADLAFDASGTLYGVTGDGSAGQPRTLFTLDKGTGAATVFMPLGNGDDGESIAYNSDNGLLYHSSGTNEDGFIPPPGGLFFESINLVTRAAPTRITLTTTTAAAINEAGALTYAGGGAFIWSSLDFGQTQVFRLMRVTSAGVVSTIGTTDHVATGLAFVPAPPPGNPLPAITSTNPASVAATSGAFTLTVTGTGFFSGSTVRWNGANRTTTFVSATQLTAAISAADVATAGTAQLTVVNPPPGGGASAARSFPVTAPTGNPVPTITSTSPASVAANSGAFTLTVTGTGFVTGSTVQWNGASRTTTFVSATQVTASVSAADIATTGTAQVTVVNPAPGGGTSAARSFSITPPGPPTVGFIEPLSRATYRSNSADVSVRLAVGGDQTGIVEYLVKFRNSPGGELVLRPPVLVGQISQGGDDGWKTLGVDARNAAGTVVASAQVEYFSIRTQSSGPDNPIDNCLFNFLVEIANNLAAPSAPRPSFPPRQALLAAAADLVDIDLNTFRAFRDNVLSTTPAGRYYTNIYERTSFSLIEIAVRDPALALVIYQAVQDWTPAIRALVNQQGGTVTITPAMAIQVQTMLTNLRRSATGELATIMDTEIAALNPSSWAGMTIGQLLARVESQQRTSPTLLAPGRISNMSIRSSAGTGAQTLIVGAVIGGESPLSTKPLLIRGIGPALTAFGVPGALADPSLTVFAGANVVASNDNWNGDAQVTAIGNAVGAFGLAPATSRDAALYSPALAPRDYTIQITGAGGATGVTLAEIYDATPADSFLRTSPQLVNVSARTQVGTGADILIAGFTLAGDIPRRLLIRAVGPTLGAFGVTGTLADPQLALYSGTTQLQQNNDWGAAANAAEITTATTQLGTFQLGAGARDSAILTRLQPGSYTAQISGVGNTTGVALVEIYVLP